MKKIPDLTGLSVEEAKELLRKKSIEYDKNVKKIFKLFKKEFEFAEKRDICTHFF